MEERKDKDLGSIFNAKSLFEGQGARQRDTAQSRKVALDFAGMLSKEGTSEGARKGWEARRAGGEGGGYVTPGMPLKGHPYHEKTEAELKYIVQDAGEAARNMRDLDPKAEGKYLDQINDAHTVLAYRKRQGISEPLKLPKKEEPSKTMKGSFSTEGE